MGDKVSVVEFHGPHGEQVPCRVVSQIVAFAGLWDRSVKPDGSAVESCTHITMLGNELMREIHNAGGNPYRMPAILKREDWEAWLTGTPEQARAVLQPYPSARMAAHPVSPNVNSPKNDSPDLIDPLAA